MRDNSNWKTTTVISYKLNKKYRVHQKADQF